MLDLALQPAWLLRRDGYIEHANRAAVVAMRQAGWVGICHGCLTTLGSADVLQLIAKREDGRGRVDAAVAGSLGPRRARVFATPVPDSSPLLTAWPQARWLVTMTPPDDDPVSDSWIKALAKRYALTPAESKVLKLLASGYEPLAIAEMLDIGYVTVRSQLAALYEKTVQRRQADLARLVVGSE